jgi:hypothetical protein
MSYVAILDTQLEPDAPLTSQLMFQNRDNPIAMFAGLAGAPRLQGAAHPEFLPGVVVLDRVGISGQETLVFQPEGGGGGFTFINIHEFNAIRGGSLQLYCELRTAPGNAARIAVFVAGAMVAEETTISTSFVSKFVNFTYAAGDQVYFRLGLDYDSSDSYAWMRNLEIRADQLGTYRT